MSNQPATAAGARSAAAGRRIVASPARSHSFRAASAAHRARPGSGVRARRISGPSAGALALEDRALPLGRGAQAAPLRRPARPATAPARRNAPSPNRTTRTRRPAAPARRQAPRIANEALPGLLGHRLVEGLVKGRFWIAVICFALIGIVAMQLFILRLNTDFGHALERKLQLQRTLAALEIANSSLSSPAQVQEQARRLGMQLPAEGQVGLLNGGGNPVAAAAKLLGAARQATAEGAQAQGQGVGATAGAGGGTSTPEGAQAAAGASGAPGGAASASEGAGTATAGNEGTGAASAGGGPSAESGAGAGTASTAGTAGAAAGGSVSGGEATAQGQAAAGGSTSNGGEAAANVTREGHG